MLRFCAIDFVYNLTALDSAARLDVEDDPEHRAKLLGYVKEGLAGLGHSAPSWGLSEFQAHAESVVSKFEAGEVDSRIVSVTLTGYQSAVMRVMEKTVLFVLDPGDLEVYNGCLLTEVAASAFPTSNEQLDEAGKCFALGRFTAAVFHAMCALEPALDSLRRSLRVQHKPGESWSGTIDRIESTISKMQRGQTKASRERRHFLSEAATNFRFFKDAWRNHVAHARQTYSREQAERIFDHTRSFVEHLSQRLRQRTV